MYEYRVISKWCGWFGGWGSESDIAALINQQAAEGWRLVRSENGVFFWFLIPTFWRRKVLLIFEREQREESHPSAAQPNPTSM